MTTPGNIRTQMIQRAARLVFGTQNEEAWHLVGLFQQTQPTTFLQICHHLLASFLELNHDYFDQDWPLTTRLLKPSANLTESRRSRNRVPSELFEFAPEFVFPNPQTPKSAKHPIGNQQQQISNNTLLSPIVFCSRPFGISDTSTGSSSGRTDRLGKFKSRAGKRLLKQLLPSRPPTPISAPKATCFEWTPTKSMDRIHGKTRSFFKQSTRHLTTPFSHPDDFLRSGYSLGPAGAKILLPPFQTNSDNRFTLNSCCNVDTTICATLIEYMLANPQICMTEGIFRVPGNSVRIRDLWLNLYGQIQAPYLRVSQPEPDFHSPTLSPHPVECRHEFYQFLNAYSPHDIASLLLRCLSTCAQNSDHNGRPICINQCTDDLTANHLLRGLIPSQAGELLFLATKLQYVLDDETGKENSEDWMQILCHSRQLLAYRIVIQLLLPAPERYLLMELLRLLKQISKHGEKSKMSAQCLARCIAFAVFGTPLASSSENVSNSNSTNNPLRWRIDTLHNLIELADQLEDLPGVIYNAVRDRLRSRLGNSPIPRPNTVHGALLLGKSTKSQFDSETSRCTKSMAGSLIRSNLPLVLVNSNENRCMSDQLSSNSPKRSASTDRNHPLTKHTTQTTPDLLISRGHGTRVSLHRAKSTLDQVSRKNQARSSHHTIQSSISNVDHVSAPFHNIWRRQKHSSSELRTMPPNKGRKNWLTKVKSSASLVQESRPVLSN